MFGRSFSIEQMDKYLKIFFPLQRTFLPSGIIEYSMNPPAVGSLSKFKRQFLDSLSKPAGGVLDGKTPYEK